MKHAVIKIALCVLFPVVMFVELWLAWWIAGGNMNWFNWVLVIWIGTGFLLAKFFPKTPKKESKQ